MPGSAPNRDALKRLAAQRAVDEVKNGMVVGLGTGSTAAFAIEIIGRLVSEGLRIIGIPTSDNTAQLAKHYGIPLTDFAEHRRIDLTIDGADQVERGTFNLIKGLGGALLREKIVASASERMIVIIDESKLVDRLGANTPLPVEIVPFGWQIVLDRLAEIGCVPKLRGTEDQPFVTDGGHYIADCVFPQISDPAGLQERLAAIVGVVETGLFIGMASAIVVGRKDGVEVLGK